MSYALVKVTDASDWRDYHAIRRRVLFEARMNFSYDETRPDEHKPNHHPLLLKLAGRAIGTARLDDLGDGSAIVRLVAIREGAQNQGHGRELARHIEDYAASLGVTRLLVNAAAESVGYYEKLGWSYHEWDKDEAASAMHVSRQMHKCLNLPILKP